MRDAIGEVLPLAVGVALSPLPIVAIVLMLVTPRARTNGPAFVIGWLLGLAVVGTIVLSVVGPSDPTDDGGQATWVTVLQFVLGALLLLLAVRQWRSRPQAGEEPAVPKWMGTLDGFTAPRALLAGGVLSGVNPKNLLLAAGAAAAIARTDISGGEQAAAYTVFALLGTLGVAVPLVIYFALGDRSARVLESLKDWMARNNAVVTAVLLLVLGAKLVGDGIAGL